MFLKYQIDHEYCYTPQVNLMNSICLLLRMVITLIQHFILCTQFSIYLFYCAVIDLLHDITHPWLAAMLNKSDPCLLASNVSRLGTIRRGISKVDVKV